MIQAKERNDVTDFTIYHDGSTASITTVLVFYPHFRTKHQERYVVFASNANAGSTNIFFQHAHTLDIFNNTLEERQSIIFDYIAIFINQQHTQIMNIKMLLALLIQTIYIFNDELVSFLVRINLALAQLVNSGQSFVRQA